MLRSRVLGPTRRKVGTLTGAGAEAAAWPTLCVARRGIRVVTPIGHRGPLHYSGEQRFVAGQDVALKHTECYEGYTDDFGTYKDGPPQTLRLEYLRSPEHRNSQTIQHRFLWSPFEAGADLKTYTPLYANDRYLSSHDYWGHRNGPAPGDLTAKWRGFYERKQHKWNSTHVTINTKPQMYVPKWLSCIVHDLRRKRFVGFFLYADGAYCAELLTYKQLPRLAYNRPYNACMPTIGQRVQLGDVSYGKEVMAVEGYPGYGARFAMSAGTACVVLRGTDPNLVPLLLPSKEVRLFDKTAAATFGRNAGVMYRQAQYKGRGNKNFLNPTRNRVTNKKKRVSEHNAGGGYGWKRQLQLPLNYREFPVFNCKTKYWLSGYIVRGHQYTKMSTVADLKSKAYNLGSRDPVYR